MAAVIGISMLAAVIAAVVYGRGGTSSRTREAEHRVTRARDRHLVHAANLRPIQLPAPSLN